LFVFCQVPIQRPDTPSALVDGAAFHRDSKELHPHRVRARASTVPKDQDFMAQYNRHRPSDDKRRR
jgi:hypothetical protein